MIAEFTLLVGLIASYKQLKDSRESADLDDFRNWLIHHKFEDLSNQIVESNHLNVELGELLRMDTSDILRKLETIESAVLSIAARFEGFDQVASRVGSSDDLSAQACSIIKAFEAIESGCGILMSDPGDSMIYFLPTGNGRYQPNEQRFFQDDLEILAGLGWLSVVGHTNEGRPKLQITRAGAIAAQNIK